MNDKNKTILFVMRSATHFNYFASIHKALIERGFKVISLFHRILPKAVPLLETFKAKYPTFEYRMAVGRGDKWVGTLFLERVLASNRRYIMVKHQSDYYSDRYRKFLPGFWQRMFNNALGRFVIKSWLFGFILRFMERVTPPDERIVADIESINPDAVIASPVNRRFLSSDTEYLKAANSLGIPTFLPVMTWDNLTTKGLFTVHPQNLLAWNQAHFAEAIEHHHIDPKTIKIIGAPVFDEWFNYLKPKLSREEFCLQNGLNPQHPIVTYLGSSNNIAKDETWLISDLRKALNDSSDLQIKNTQIIVRPHPANYEIYDSIAQKPGIFILPKKGTLPNTESALQFFSDTLNYSLATAGVNTSAMIDAIIVDRPVIAVVTEKYQKTQSEAQHFRQLMDGDVLEMANSTEEFVNVLKKLMDGKDSRAEKRQKFVRDFVRPRGLNVSAGEVVAGEILASLSSREV